VNLRDAVCAVLTELIADGDRLILSQNLTYGDLDQAIAFVGRVRVIVARLLAPASRLRAPALVRRLEALAEECTGPLEQLRPPLLRATRRARALAAKNRRWAKNGAAPL
jgi:hypothetical protein